MTSTSSSPSAFDRLSPALQYHIVNDLGWTELRPVQQLAINAILDGDNCVILAPTAGGKTEAALFPLISQMDSGDWQPTSVLYIAPIRALLNNQQERLEHLTGLVGRRAMKWHGDVAASKRKAFVREPADVLAITPESIESMLISETTPGRHLLAHVRAVVIDEVHAFAADDRGAHLMALLERITKICGRDIQRIGLSATVGDPEAIAAWLSGSSRRPRGVVDPGSTRNQAEITLDFVNTIQNAALMIDRLRPGTRRLVFVDSRRRVEALGDELQRRKVDVLVTHSSLAASERHAAERAFEQGRNCVIVATSALELGIDVGDLDHVMQVDAPSTVSSFLQRMGRTGRRAGSVANCTLLATKRQAVLQSAALLRLYDQGYVEPTEPTRWAPHILAQQVMALTLQEHGVPTDRWWRWIDGAGPFTELGDETRQQVLTHMLAEDIVAEVDGRLVLGDRGQKLYGKKHFLDLLAVFSTPRVLKVMHGNREVGTVDAFFVQKRDDGPIAFVLGGRPWEVVTVNWRSGTCLVRPAQTGTYPRWMGRPVLLRRSMCRAMWDVLRDNQVDERWSKRAAVVIEELRAEYGFEGAGEHEAPLVWEAGEQIVWWTFAGGRANALLALILRRELGADRVTANNLAVRMNGDAAVSEVAVREAIRGIVKEDAFGTATALLPDSALGRLSKFRPCLPEQTARKLAALGELDVEGAWAAIMAAS